MTLRICFLAGNLAEGGGVNRVIRDLATIFGERIGADVTVIAAATTGESMYPFPPSVRVEYRTTQVEALAAVRRAKADFAIGSWTQSNLMLVAALLFSRTRVVAIEHTSWYFHPPSIRRLRRWLYRLAWRVVVLNPRELAHYREYLSNVRLIPNPVPALPGPSRASREKLIVAIGHLEPRKNFIDAVRAMALSKLEERGWELAIIGAGPEEEHLRAAIRAAGLERTHIHPPTSDLAPWYNRSSLTLVTAKLEVFSLVLAEAMSTGVVPIAYAADGPRFILEDFPTHLVPIGDVDALAERMRELADSDMRPLRAELENSIGRRFAPEKVAEEWRKLLSEALPDRLMRLATKA